MSERSRPFAIWVVITALSLLWCGSATAQNLIKNPSFEINGGAAGTSPEDWYTITNSFGVWDGIVPAQDGTWVLHAGAGFGAGGRYQDIGTVVNEQYDLSFWATGFISGLPEQQGIVQVGTRGSNDNDLALNNNAEYINDQFTVPLFDAADDWVEFMHTFTATSPVTRISFQNVDLGPNNSAINIDSVSVIGPAGPPPPPPGGSEGNLVYNGSFEINGGAGTQPEGWNAITNSFGAWNGIAAQDGSWVLHAGADFGAGGRFQDLSTTPGQEYALEFSATGFISGLDEQQGIVQVGTPGSDNSDLLNNNNAELINQQFTVPLFQSFDDWTAFSYVFTATADVTRLSFQNVDMGAGNSAINIDKVSVIAVPEPSTAVMMVTLLLGVMILGWPRHR